MSLPTTPTSPGTATGSATFFSCLEQFNASYNDDPYEKKLPHYFGQNLLAASLNSLSYEKNPGFVSFIKSSGLPFKPYEEFKATAITERGNLYRGIAKKVWNPDDLLATAEGRS